MYRSARKPLLPSFNTQPPEGGWRFRRYVNFFGFGFNTQPPEGGWRFLASAKHELTSFNTQPPEGGWDIEASPYTGHRQVSTHSRPKAAGSDFRNVIFDDDRFNTQPPEGGWVRRHSSVAVGTRFQHTAARRRLANARVSLPMPCKFQHTAARRRLDSSFWTAFVFALFQHTAARRRLGVSNDKRFA